MECDYALVKFIFDLIFFLAPNYEMDEEATDPDYIVAEKVLVDAEELRDVNVSKKELNDLRNALWESLPIDITELLFGDQQQNYFEIEQENLTTLITSTKATSSITTTSCKLQTNEIESKKIIEKAIISTVTSPDAKNSSIVANDIQCQNNNQIIAPATNEIPQQSSNINQFVCHHPMPSTQHQQDGITIPMIINAASPNIQYQPYVATMPINLNDSTNQPKTLATNESQINKRKQIQRGKFKYNKFIDLENWNQTICDNEIRNLSNENGFTELQRNILDQQLRLHVQLIAQNFMQTYGHPKLYSYANCFLKFAVMK